MGSGSKLGEVAILGQGYVGLPLSLAATQAGWKVYGLDIDPSKVKDLVNGKSHIEDVSHTELSIAIDQGLTFSSDMSLISECEIIIICVPTPLDANSNPDLSMLESAIESVSKFARNNALLVNESTSYPTTTRHIIAEKIKELSPNLELLYAVAPERVDPGNLNWTYQKTPRLVSGLDAQATKRAIDFYSTFCESVIPVEKPEIAEFAKVLENSFRQVNIALVNELTPLALRLGISMFDVIEAAASKPYGYMPFRPGVGVGGHCIPVDPMFLASFAKSQSIPTTMIELAQQINHEMTLRVNDMVLGLGVAQSARVLLVGLAYKSGTQDIRESPSVKLFDLLSQEYRNLSWWDESVNRFRNIPKANLNGQFELVILTHKVQNEKLLDVITNATHVVDCTGQFRERPNVVSL